MDESVTEFTELSGKGMKVLQNLSGSTDLAKRVNYGYSKRRTLQDITLEWWVNGFRTDEIEWLEL